MDKSYPPLKPAAPAQYPPPPVRPSHDEPATERLYFAPPPGQEQTSEVNTQGSSVLMKDNASPEKVEDRKPGFISIVRNLSFVSLSSGLGIRPPTHGVAPVWTPRLLQPLPLIGIAALLGTVCCLVASLGILVGSHGRLVDDWTWPPSVFLAIFSAAINKFLAFALLQALPIAWWHQAYQGASLAQLHRRWEAGEGIFRAIKNAPHEKLLAFATIACALVIIDGPFLQKASSIRPETQTKPAMLEFGVTPELPKGFSGTYDSHGVETSWAITPALVGFTENSTIQANITGCTGTCRAKVHGPGVVISNCTSKDWPLDRKTLTQNATASWGSGTPRRTGQVPIFNIQFHDSALFEPFAGPEAMELWIGVSNYTNCSGKYIEQTCKITAAILEYEVIVQDENVLNFARPPNEAPFVSYVNNTYVNASDDVMPLTFTALGVYLHGSIVANATMIQPIDNKPGTPALLPNQESYNNMVTKYTLISAPCESAFADPRAEILADFNNLMFRAGIAAANLANSSHWMDPGISLSQKIQGNQTLTQNVFRSDLSWWAGAAIFEILAVLAIAPVFWGWWRLGLRATLSPLEIAKAFDAPLLQDVNCAAGSRGIVRSVGDKRVQYGAYADEYTRNGGDEGMSSARLGFADVDRVVRPRRGQRFGT